jgi:UDP-glucuronate 4-epimerase
MRTILVTGAAGFIGSHLVEALLEAGVRVVGVDSFAPTYDPAIKLANLARAQANPGFRLCEVDVRDEAALRAIVDKSRPSAAVHLAARVGAGAGLANPGETWDVNVNGTASVVSACGRIGTGVVVVSSASVYGPGPDSGCCEATPLTRPANPYVASKQAGEQAALEEAQKHGVGAVIVRLASTYGPRQRPGTGLDTFAARLLRGEPVPLFMDKAVARDLLFVSDAVRALVLAAERALASDTVNIGSGRSVRMEDVVKGLADAFGVRADIVGVPATPGYEAIPVMDVDRARTRWNFEPRVPLPEGLARYARWYRTRAGGGLA